MPDHSNDTTARDQLLKLARDLPYLANAKSTPVSVVRAEAKAKLQAIEAIVRSVLTDQQPSDGDAENDRELEQIRYDDR